MVLYIEYAQINIKSSAYISCLKCALQRYSLCAPTLRLYRHSLIASNSLSVLLLTNLGTLPGGKFYTQVLLCKIDVQNDSLLLSLAFDH